MQAAFNRIAEEGFEGLRLRHVADEVGIDHSTLHHHVSSKRELVAAVVSFTTQSFRETMSHDPDPAKRLQRHMSELQRLLRVRPELLVVTAELDLRARRDAAVREVVEAHEAGWRAALVESFTSLQAAGRLPAGTSPEDAAELLIATVKGVRLVPELAPRVFAQLQTLLGVTEQREPVDS